jgi:DnaJ-class molecular chaperone
MHPTRGMTCWKCKGQSWVVEEERPGYTVYKPCPICSGHGTVR